MQYLLLDGFNLAFRSFYGVPELSRTDGFPTNAIHGWHKTLTRLQEDFPQAKLIAFFDSGGDDFRQELYSDYKANRSEMPENLSKQLPVIEEMTKHMGIPLISTPGIEADDLLASHALYFAKKEAEVIMVSADKDLAQIVDDKIKQLLPPPTANPRLGWRLLDAQKVKEKFGVAPDKIIDYLALVGDSSDNIPGLAGVGPKTAAKWINEYGNVAQIIESASDIKPPRFQKILPDSSEQLRVNLQLVTLRTDLPIAENLTISPNPDALLHLLADMEMKTTAKRVQQEFNLA